MYKGRREQNCGGLLSVLTFPLPNQHVTQSRANLILTLEFGIRTEKGECEKEESM